MSRNKCFCLFGHGRYFRRGRRTLEKIMQTYQFEHHLKILYYFLHLHCYFHRPRHVLDCFFACKADEKRWERKCELGTRTVAFAALCVKNCCFVRKNFCSELPYPWDLKCKRNALNKAWGVCGNKILANSWSGQKKKKGKWSMVYHGLPSFQAPSMSSPLLAKSFGKGVIVNLELRYLCVREEKLLLFFLSSINSEEFWCKMYQA